MSQTIILYYTISETIKLLETKEGKLKLCKCPRSCVEQRMSTAYVRARRYGHLNIPSILIHFIIKKIPLCAVEGYELRYR